MDPLHDSLRAIAHEPPQQSMKSRCVPDWYAEVADSQRRHPQLLRRWSALSTLSTIAAWNHHPRTTPADVSSTDQHPTRH
jgi:hypothetical protein